MNFILAIFATYYFPLLFLLLVGHALADYAFQNDFVAQYKGRGTPLGKQMFPHVMLNHALIHGGAVAVIAILCRSPLPVWYGLALAETAAHFVIDFAKTEKKIGFHTDQFLHWGCKAIWALLIIGGQIYAMRHDAVLFP